MNTKFLLQLTFIIYIFTIIKSLDEHTLSNYQEIPMSNLTGLFELDFNKKIVIADLNYTFKANSTGSKITLDSNYLNLSSITKIVPEGENIPLKFDFGETDKILGVPLNIHVDYKEGEEIQINIKYSTTTEGGSAQFLNKDQTVGKKYPYFFTQSALTYGRELLPCQDTPAVKFPFYLGIKVMNPLIGKFSGLFDRKEENDDDTTTFYYVQKIPIPTYLIAFAAGNFAEKKISDNISVFTEPEYIEEAAKEFEDMPKFLDYAVSYMGEYRWGQYNVLVMPYSFPFSGMENPCLTFDSPCLINGDKSLVDIIVHELIHSWSGNLVTNENWRDFWLNEGITKFLQRKVIAEWRGEDYAKMDYILGLSYIKKYLALWGTEDTRTSLRPNMTGIRPDDAFSNIPYEKGSNFVYYLEGIVGSDTIKAFFESYFEHFIYKSIDVFNFKDYFIEFCNEKGVSKEKMDSIKWTDWIFGTGDCPVQNDFSNVYNDQLVKTKDRFLKEDFDGLAEQFNNMTSSAKTVFFLQLEENKEFLTDKQHDFLTNTLKLYKDQNFLVTTHYLRLILKQTDKFYEHELECLTNYLTTYGVVDFMDGIYRFFYKRDEIKSVEILNSCKDFYHSFMRGMANNEIEDAKHSFPILSLDIQGEDTCLLYSKENKINLKVKLVDEVENVTKINLKDGITLAYGNNSVKLECQIDYNNNESYCLPLEDIKKSGEYHLTIANRIQKQEFAIRNSTSNLKYKIYLKETKVDEEKTKNSYMIDYGEKENGETILINFSEEADDGVSLMNGDKEIPCNLNSEKKVLECKINNDVLNYDKSKPNEYKNYTLKLCDLCGNDKYSLDVLVKNTKHKETEGKKGLGLLEIILISLAVLIVAVVIVFLIIRAIRKNKKVQIKYLDAKEEMILKDE